MNPTLLRSETDVPALVEIKMFIALSFIYVVFNDGRWKGLHSNFRGFLENS